MTGLPTPSATRDRAIVLVHGAWVGEWSWLPIEATLRASGRPVHVVSLTGQGARRHQGGPHVTLSDHVADVVGVIKTFDLTNVVLVGHSYGGRVITRVWDEIADRIGHLVFVDGHAPVAPETGQTPERIAAAEANGGMLPFAGYNPDPELVGGEAGVEWFLHRTVHMPWACLTEEWQRDLPDALAKTFVFAAANQPSRFAAYAEVIEQHPHWDYHVLDGPHFLMMSHPEEVSSIILNAVSAVPST